MRLIELRLKNLNSLKGEWRIDFSDPAFINEGIFAITGQTGAGKTTILDAICLALYSQTPRLGDITGSTNEIMTQGTGECSAEVIIEINSKRYQCYWYQHRAHKKAKGNLLPIKHEISEAATGKILEEKKSKTSAYIQDLIGMDFNQFTRSIMLAQGSFAAFLKSDTGDRAEILEKITGTAIYAKISSSVHEKKRMEEETLGKLQAGVDGLSLLSLDDEKQLTTELETLNEQQEIQRHSFKTLSEQMQWLDSVEQLAQDQLTYQDDFAAAQQAHQAFTPAAKRLEVANKALELESQFQALSHSRESVKQLNTERQGLLDQIPEQQSKRQQTKAALERCDALANQAKDNLRTTLPIIAKTRELDADIKQHTNALADDTQRKQRLTNDIQQLRQEITSHKQSEQQTKTQLRDIETFFSDYQELNDLDTDIATFDSNGHRLKTLLQDNVRLTKETATHDQHTSVLHTQRDKLAEKQETNEKAITKQRDELADLQKQQADIIREQPLASMRHEQDQVDDIHTQLAQVSHQLQQLSDVASQINDTNQSLPKLNDELAALEKSIARHQSDLQEAKKQKHDRQDLLNALQTVASLEEHIAKLEDGTPCPLCGSQQHPYGTYHPLREHHNANQHQPSKIQQNQQKISEIEAVIDGLQQDLSQYDIDHATQKEMLNSQQQQLAPLQQKLNAICVDIQTCLSSLFATENNYPSSVVSLINPLSQVCDDLKISDITSDTSNNTSNNLASIDNTVHTEAIERALSVLAIIQQKLLAHKQSLKALLVEYESLTDSVSTLSRTIEAEERQQHTLTNEMNQLATELKLHAQKIDGIEDKIADNYAELAPIMSVLSSVVLKYPIHKYITHNLLAKNSRDAVNNALSNTVNNTLNDAPTYALSRIDYETESATAIEHTLEQLSHRIYQQTIMDDADYGDHIDKLRQQRSALGQLRQKLSETKIHQQQIDNQLSRIAAQIEIEQAQLSKDETDLDELEKVIAQKLEKIDQLNNHRKEIFADKNTDAEDAQLRHAVDTANSALVNAQRQLDTVQHGLEQLNLRKQQLDVQHQSAVTTMDTQQHTFAESLTDSQFVDEAAFVSARLPKSERETLQAQKLAVDNDLQQTKSQLDTTLKALADKRAEPMTDESREVLAGQHAQIQTDIENLSQSIGAIDQKLKDNDDRKSAQAEQLIAINEQKQNLQVWQQLHSLIGSADGKKYRTFAQGLTFDIMVKHANAQLHKMSDRYLLARDDNSPLELNVIDNYQGGEIRSTKNLSGGEGFIISLALALGLSKMASHNIRVDSLFLDEGFGTLDEESLDIALDTLTSLQQEGKLIGVISHVQALKERILTQIKVQKLSGGFSQISGQGCQKIER
ncbi:AAA family ATPase [Psychrobacter sp.]|uniref:AAA family ATPase n=1 Tax=Psychrobacter sp. TaxID=56811 RepID=UPI002649999C|nr:AAA family ATPase [Psychrobacter sp.]MDN6307413.1 AAA family ATPase [Psychrobacter sp.]